MLPGFPEKGTARAWNTDNPPHTARADEMPVILPVPTAEGVDEPSIAASSALHKESPRYCELVRQALAMRAGVGFGDVERLDAFRLTGPDNHGRPVFMFLPAAIPETEETEAIVEKLTLYVLSLVHDLVVNQQQGYTAIWMCNNHSESRPLSVRWFYKMHRCVPYCYHERLAGLCLVHPSVTVRCLIFLLSYLPRVSFWEKLNYCDRLEFLDADVPVALIKTVPQLYKDYDKQLDREMYESADRLGAGGAHGGSSMAGMAGMGGLPDGLGMGVGGMGMGGVPGVFGGASAEGEQSVRPKVDLPKRNWETD